MRLYLGGFYTFYHPQGRPWLEVHLTRPLPLAEVLEGQGIPAGEVYLAVVNGEVVETATAVVGDGDEVRIYPPVGGGSERGILRI